MLPSDFTELTCWHFPQSLHTFRNDVQGQRQCVSSFGGASVVTSLRLTYMTEPSVTALAEESKPEAIPPQQASEGSSLCA